MERITNMVKQSPKHIFGRIIDNHIILDIVGEEAHYWSPQLNFRVEEEEDDPGTAVIAGLIGPKPGVWTLFVFIYFSVGITGFVISSYGVSRYMIGTYTPWIFAFPVAILFMLTAYKAGKYGEQLGADQIEMLKDFIREAITIPEDTEKGA